jgi:4-hydroxy-tetrahydrodipicolinate synthase
MTTHKPMLRGIFTALVTPFSADGRIDFAAYRGLIDQQLAMGVTGLVPCGTTGEAATLSTDEHLEVVRVCVEQVNGRAKVIAGASANDTRAAVHLHQQVARLGVDAALHATPWYNKPTQAGLIAHYSAVASSHALPVVLYNVPGRTGVDMSTDTVVNLVKTNTNVVALKDATGSVARSQELLNRLHKDAPHRTDFSLLSGDDGHILSLLALGGHGVISVTSHLCGAELVAMMKAFDDVDLHKAQALSRRTSPLSVSMFFRSNPLPVKTALAMRGQLPSAHFRLPLCTLDDGEVKQLRTLLTQDGWL